jgi:hypothetical protein
VTGRPWAERSRVAAPIAAVSTGPRPPAPARLPLAQAIARVWHYPAPFCLRILDSTADVVHAASAAPRTTVPYEPAFEETRMLRYLIGIGIPYLGVIGVLPWVAAQDRYVLGVPFIFMWIFAWFVLTSGCLFACWMLFDRRASGAA